MRLTADQLNISELIVHELPLAAADGSTVPRLSDLPSPDDRAVSSFFETRAARALTKDGNDVVFQTGDAIMPRVITSLLFDKAADFVALSKEAATHLFNIQRRNVSPGLLTVGRATYEGAVAILVTKLEKTQGVDIKEEPVGDKIRLSIGHVPNLMLTDNTRIFKIALFIAEPGSIAASVCDRQADAYGTHQVADFFLDKFLHCALRERPDLSTQKFYVAAQAFINQLEEPERQAEYQIGLLAELNSQATEVRPQEFARRVLLKRHQAPFLASLKEIGLRGATIKKDVKLIASKLTRARWSFAHDMTLIGTPESLAERVEVSKDDAGGTQVIISDEIERFG
jgi:hypothetical protein